MRRYRKYRRYMRREKRTYRKERSFHRWLAVFMAAVLLMSECNLTVLAEEGTPYAETQEGEVSDEVSSEETEDVDVDDIDGTDNVDDTDGTDNVDDTDDTDDEGELPNEDIEEENICSCVSKCSEDMINADCPVCVESYEDCSGLESEEPGVLENVAVIAESEVFEDEGIETYEVVNYFTDELGISYSIIKDDEGDRQVEVARETYQTLVVNDVRIPKTVDYHGSSYKVTRIGGGAFDDCNSLTSIEIPESVTSIGANAFQKCSSLTSIKIPDGVTSIGDSVFYGCNNLSSIEIPESVTSIGNSVFMDCSSLTSIEIPDGVTSIGNNAFFGCKSLTDVEIPDGVTSIGSNAFLGCESLTDVEIPNSVTSIDIWAFYGCSSLSSIEIPDGVTSIGDSAFYGCNSLTSIEIPESVTSIGDSAFYGCSSLSSIEIPDGVTSIGNSAFYGCSSLSSIEIPDGVTSIGGNAFAYCSSLTSIEIPDGVTSIDAWAFYSCSSLTTIKIPDGITSISIGVFNFCSSLTSMEIPDGVTSIGNAAFEGCSSLTTIKIPDGVTSIGNSAFYGCSSLTSIEIPDGVTSIGYGAFGYCSSLTSIKIPDGVTSIGSNAFINCRSLTSIEIPKSVTSIGDEAFWLCKELKTLRIVVSTDGAVINIPTVVLDEYGDHAFWGTPDNRAIVFVTEDGSPLTGSALEAAKNAFKADDDGDTTDNFWWGWKLGDIADDAYHITYHLEGYEASKEDSTYTYGVGITLPKPQHSDYDFDGWYTNEDYSGDRVTAIGSTETGDKVFYGRWVEKPESAYRVDVKVRRDGGEWENHGRTFMLLSAAGDKLTANFETVEPGEYYIYDVTGVPSESLATDGVNTEVRVLVEDKDVEATVDYYTVTFYDGSTAYGADTLQKVQTVLSGKRATEPKAPSKAGYTFNRWMTAPDGSEVFDFSVPIGRKSDVYASWISNAATEYYITAMAGEGGSISPEGNVRVQEGGTQTFEITPDDGYRIKNVTVDGMNRTDELTDSAGARAIRAQAETSRYYTFVDVRESHTIRATFEKENGSGNTGDSGNTGTGDNTGDSGNTGTGGNGGDNGNDGTGGNTGDSDNTGAGGTGGDSDNAFINISNVENAGGSQVENSSLSTTSGDARVINSNNNSTNNNTSNSSKDTEPKTGDASQVEIYATVAMIAGLTYLLLYFADKERGMTEEKKEELVASMVGWAKRGRRIRKYVVLVPIFILLCYYHSIGKRIEVEWDEEPVWAEL